MLIECLIRRPGGTVLGTPSGAEYHFKPNESGAHVADVGEDDVERFIPYPCSYRAWWPGAKNPWRAGEGYNDGKPAKAKKGGGSPRNLDQMDHTQLFDYAEALGMRRPHPAISTNKLRENIARFLDERSDQLVPAAEPEAEQMGDDEADE